MGDAKTKEKKEFKINFNRYYKKDHVLDHESELAFYEILRDEILGEKFITMIQIPLSSLIGIAGQYRFGGYQHFDEISRRRVDFLICRKDDLEPLLAIELDGSSHKQKKRKERDIFVNKVFEAIKFPLLRIEVQEKYDRKDIALKIVQELGLIKK